MAIIQEHITIDEQEFIRIYSDRNVMIHGGFPEADYAEAIDPASMNRTYTETEIPIPDEDATAEEVVDILTGVEA